MKFIKRLKYTSFLFALIFFFISCGDIPETQGLKKTLFIKYPRSGVVFPPEFPPPTFHWSGGFKTYDHFLVCVPDPGGNRPICRKKVTETSWKPSKSLWKNMKKASSGKELVLQIFAFKNGKTASFNEIQFTTSKDSVGAPIFFRNVPLPFDYANKHKDILSWHLGNVASEKEPKMLMTGIPVCANCHSFTADGKTLAMDVDYSNDKGNYAIAQIEKNTSLSPDKIISWSDYKREDGDFTFALLSQISPDGRYVVSTVKDRSIFVPVDDLEYSQLFFPFKGILAIYDREKREFYSLPGADDPELVQSSPCWSPDGKTILFARAKRYHDPEAEKSQSAVLGTGIAEEFTSGRVGFRYDLYKVPFNNGKGGTAVPVTGAAHNGKSNYFARYSPDGKWIVFCQANDFMLLQKSSKMFIAPADGGAPREMTCNTDNMNSWHSWSPNSRWLVFATKKFGPYTQLMLTHIDKNGNDSPPVLLENFRIDNRAANIPEFVNTDYSSLDKITDDFSKTGNYYLRSATELYFLNETRRSIENFNKAIELDPDNYKKHFIKVRLIDNVSRNELKKVSDKISDHIMTHPMDLDARLDRAEVYLKMNNYESALSDCRFVINQRSDSQRALQLMSSIQQQTGQTGDALSCLNRMIELNPRNADNYSQRSLIHFRNKEPVKAVADARKAVELDAMNHEYAINLGIYLAQTGHLKEAEKHLNKSLDLKPDFYYALYIRGLIKKQAGRNGDARRDFLKAINEFDRYRKDYPDMKPVITRSMIQNEL